MSTSASPAYNKPRISSQIPKSTIVMPGLKSIASLTYISYNIRTANRNLVPSAPRSSPRSLALRPLSCFRSYASKPTILIPESKYI